MVDLLTRDLRYAGRGLLRSPGVTVIAVIALALGVGLTTLMFSIVYGALHRGLPFEGAERIIHLERGNPSEGASTFEVTMHDWADWRERQRSFENLAAFYMGTVNIRGTERPERFEGAFMSADALDVVHVEPVIGRWFTEEEASPGGRMAVVLGHRVWQDRFGGDRGVLGQVLSVNGEQAPVIGVMPEGFEFPFSQEVWVPLRVDPAATPRGEGSTLEVFGDLRPGVTLDAAAAEFSGIAAQLAEEFPETNAGITSVLKPYADEFIGPDERTLLNAMLATVMLVLLMACANVANLLLARAAVRSREVAIRTAIGASRWRVVVQLMSEAVVLAALGAVLGAVLAWIGIGMFARAVEPTDPPFWLVFKLDAPVLLFVAAIAALAAVVSGAIPAIRASSTDVNSILKDESRGSSSLQIGRLSRGLVVAEVAMSVALLVGAGLMVKSVWELEGQDLGYPTEEIYTARIGVFEERFPTPEDRERFWREVATRARALPGAEAASLTTVPPGMGAWTVRLQVEGESYTRDQDLPLGRMAVVSPGFFETFEATPVQGRLFSEQDTPENAPVAVVNESFVRRHFAEGQALGRRIRQGSLEGPGEWVEIVGVVPDLGMSAVGDPDAADTPLADAGFYRPLAQQDQQFMTLAVRARGEALALAAPVRDMVAGVDPDTPTYFERTLQAGIDENNWFYGIFGGLFAAFGAAALFLASVGLYGVMSFTVSRRSQEMGIRMALGAGARQVRQLIVRQGMGQVALGVVLGTGLAWLVTRGMQIILYRAEPWDPATWAAVLAILAGTGLLATLVPAIRATRVDPMEALRYE